MRGQCVPGSPGHIRVLKGKKKAIDIFVQLINVLERYLELDWVLIKKLQNRTTPSHRFSPAPVLLILEEIHRYKLEENQVPRLQIVLCFVVVLVLAHTHPHAHTHTHAHTHPHID